MKQFITFLLLNFLLLPLNTFSSNQEIDSLKYILSNSHEIEVRVKTYLKLSKVYQNINIDSSTYLVKQAMILAEQIDSEEDIAEAHACFGDIATRQDSLIKAINEYEYTIDYYRKTNNKGGLQGILVVYGNLFTVTSNYSEAMKAYLEVLKLSQENNKLEKIAIIYNNIGYLYFQQNNFSQALENYTKALSLFEGIKDTLNIAVSLGNVGSVYLRYNDFITARQYYMDSYNLYDLIGFDIGKSQTLVKLSDLHLINNNTDSAIYYSQKSLDLNKKNNPEYRGPGSIELVNINIKFADIYLKRKEWNKAIDYSRISYRLAIQTNQLIAVKEAASLISKAYDGLAMTDSAYFYYRLFKNYSDSLTFNENSKNLAYLDLQFKLEKEKEKKLLEDEVKRLSQKRKNLIYFSVFLGLILVLIVLSFMLKLEKNKKYKIELERQQLESDLEHKNKELTTHLLYLLKKNEFILSISEKLKKLIPEIKFQNKKHIAEVVNDLKNSTNNDVWQEFEVSFQQVHTAFFQKLNAEYTDLTPNEIRLCAFLRLNMSTKDIAAITYQSVNSITMARFRLRKKLGIDKDEHLVSFFTKF